MRNLVAFGLSTVLLSGCISLIAPATKLPPRYTLSAIDLEPQGEKYPVTLAVSDARAEAALNSSRIAVKTAPNELRYLQDADWSDRAPRVFSVLMERSFEETGQLLAVSDRVALPLADYVFYTDIAEMNLDRTTSSDRAVISFRARVEDNRGMVLGARRFDAERTVDGRPVSSTAAALNDAAAQATADAAAWAVGLIGEDVKAKPEG